MAALRPNQDTTAGIVTYSPISKSQGQRGKGNLNGEGNPIRARHPKAA